MSNEPGNIVPPIFAEGVKHAYGVDLADLADCDDHIESMGQHYYCRRPQGHRGWHSVDRILREDSMKWRHFDTPGERS